MFIFNSLLVYIPDIYFSKTNTLRFSWWDIGNQKCSTSPVEGSEWIVSKSWTGVSKSLFKIHIIRPCVNATYINTLQCVLMCILEKACKSSKTDTSAGQFLKYLDPYTQTPLQKPGGISVREVITML